ncbi:MAG: cytochrome d ubiquinol oxidase subunit II [Actinomycetota bacterium]|nr:cytochrome d ubiquinol oxidase subunit II [Actinomycetota bacterium]
MIAFASLNTTWFALIGLLWAGYFLLEGFDFGVAILAPVVSRDETDRRICLNAIGPFWDGNEVWLIVAGGATFAAFPLWYARLFSGFYLALFIVLVALIARGVSFEFRGKDPRSAWRRGFDAANFLGSAIPAIVWGVAFTDLVHGLPLDPTGRYGGGLVGLLHPVALLGGVVSLALFGLHGALFLALKTSDALAERARRAALGCGVLALVSLAGLISWLGAAPRPPVVGEVAGSVPLGLALSALLGVALALLAVRRGRAGWAFALTGAAIVVLVGAVFARMFPAVLPASNVAAHGVSIGQAASQHSTLVVMSVVAAIFTPVVLAYQAWTYWIFRKRLTRPVMPPAAAPGALTS